MGIFTKKEKKETPKAKTQVELAKEALESGEVLDMMSMLLDYGIGNHTGVIANVRKSYQREGKGYYYVETRFRYLKSRRTGRIVRVAYYFIPELVKKSTLKEYGE